jgi:hypothetical protein
MEITGTINQILPIQKGEGKNGPWAKQEVIIETNDQYPKKICISFWNDKINDRTLIIGNNLKLNISIESREFKDKWYTEIRATKVEILSQNQVTENASEIDPIFEIINIQSENDDDVLPF